MSRHRTGPDEPGADGIARRWIRKEARWVYRNKVLALEEARYVRENGGLDGVYTRIHSSDWVNVVPVLDSGEILCIRQFRFGVEAATLEIPGGMCDEGESPERAAARELQEETGHAGRSWRSLGWVHPNPALQPNRCHSYLAWGLEPGASALPEPDESFELVRVPYAEIPELIREGVITHALVVAAFHLLDLAGGLPQAMKP